MGEKISKEHARRAMEMLEDLTGGLITKEDILFRYEELRKKKYKHSRTNALWEAFSMNVARTYQHHQLSIEVLNYDSIAVDSPYPDIDIYRRAKISFPNAKPVEFVLEVYSIYKEDEDPYFTYAIYKVNNNNRSILYSSADHGETYGEIEIAIMDGLDTLVETMVVYALENTAHKEDPDVLFKA